MLRLLRDLNLGHDDRNLIYQKFIANSIEPSQVLSLSEDSLKNIGILERVKFRFIEAKNKYLEEMEVKSDRRNVTSPNLHRDQSKNS